MKWYHCSFKAVNTFCNATAAGAYQIQILVLKLTTRVPQSLGIKTTKKSWKSCQTFVANLLIISTHDEFLIYNASTIFTWPQNMDCNSRSRRNFKEFIKLLGFLEKYLTRTRSTTGPDQIRSSTRASDGHNILSFNAPLAASLKTPNNYRKRAQKQGTEQTRRQAMDHQTPTLQSPQLTRFIELHIRSCSSARKTG